MLELIAKGIGFGFNAGIAPGPLQTYLLSSTLTLGWRRALPIIFAPLITDAPIILVCLFLLSGLEQGFGGIITVIRVVGGLFVLWLAWQTWKGAQTYTPPTADSTTVNVNPLPRALIMNFVSPGPYIFWTSVTGPLLLEALDDSPLTVILYLLSFYITFLGILALLVLIFSRVGQLNPNVVQRLLMFSAVVMAFLGVWLLWEAAAGLMGTSITQ